MRKHPSIRRNETLAGTASRFALEASFLCLSAVAAPQDEATEPTAEESAEIAQPQSLEARYDNVPVGFDQRQQAIEAGLAAKAKPIWAGKYYQGDGLGMNVSLSLAPDAGAVMTWSGCLGLYGANHASVMEGDDGLIHMRYSGPNEAKTFGGFPGEFIPVSWGERQYLIPPDDLPGFASAINHGSEPRRGMRGMFLLRDGDETKPAGDPSTLPPALRERVRREPVEAKIEAVELRKQNNESEYCSRVFVVRLVPSNGAATPLLAGETLRRVGEFETATVIAANGASADAEINVSDCDDASIPKRGTTFTTSAYQEKPVDDEASM